MSMNQAENLIGQSRWSLRGKQTRQSLHLLLFALLMGVVAIGLLWHATNQSDPVDDPVKLPRSAATLALFLKEKMPQARIVSTRADAQIDRSFFLTVRDTDEAALQMLPRVAIRAEEWRGVVFCEWIVNWETAEFFLDQWGEYAFAHPPFVFFGDKELLERIKDALR